MNRSVEATASSPVAFGRARKVLLDEPGSVFSDAHTAEETRERRFRTGLSVDIGAGASVHQMVTVHLGIPQSVSGGFVVPVEWEATGREQLLPSFTGDLEVLAAPPGVRLRLYGSYTVPLGAVGRFGDGVIGHRLARRSLNTLVERLVWRLESEVRQRAGSAVWPPGPHLLDLLEQDRSEIHVG
jgi:hypothetical protein